MKRIAKVAASIAAMLSLCSSAEAGKCVVAGGEATMVTEDLAKFMAGAALKNSIAAHGWKPMGVVKMKCDAGTAGLAHCMARQKACG